MELGFALGYSERIMWMCHEKEFHGWAISSRCDRQLTYASCGVRGLGIRVSYDTYIYESTVSYLFYERKALTCTDKECQGKERLKLHKNETRMG
jgi:hypothetical protein